MNSLTANHNLPHDHTSLGALERTLRQSIAYNAEYLFRTLLRLPITVTAGDAAILYAARQVAAEYPDPRALEPASPVVARHFQDFQDSLFRDTACYTRLTLLDLHLSVFACRTAHRLLSTASHSHQPAQHSQALEPTPPPADIWDTQHQPRPRLIASPYSRPVAEIMTELRRARQADLNQWMAEFDEHNLWISAAERAMFWREIALYQERGGEVYARMMTLRARRDGRFILPRSGFPSAMEPPVFSVDRILPGGNPQPELAIAQLGSAVNSAAGDEHVVVDTESQATGSAAGDDHVVVDAESQPAPLSTGPILRPAMSRLPQYEPVARPLSVRSVRPLLTSASEASSELSPGISPAGPTRASSPEEENDETMDVFPLLQESTGRAQSEALSASGASSEVATSSSPARWTEPPPPSDIGNDEIMDAFPLLQDSTGLPQSEASRASEVSSEVAPSFNQVRWTQTLPPSEAENDETMDAFPQVFTGSPHSDALIEDMELTRNSSRDRSRSPRLPDAWTSSPRVRRRTASRNPATMMPAQIFRNNRPPASPFSPRRRRRNAIVSRINPLLSPTRASRTFRTSRPNAEMASSSPRRRIRPRTRRRRRRAANADESENESEIETQTEPLAQTPFSPVTPTLSSQHFPSPPASPPPPNPALQNPLTTTQPPNPAFPLQPTTGAIPTWRFPSEMGQRELDEYFLEFGHNELARGRVKAPGVAVRVPHLPQRFRANTVLSPFPGHAWLCDTGDHIRYQDADPRFFPALRWR